MGIGLRREEMWIIVSFVFVFEDRKKIETRAAHCKVGAIKRFDPTSNSKPSFGPGKGFELGSRVIVEKRGGVFFGKSYIVITNCNVTAAKNRRL